MGKRSAVTAERFLRWLDQGELVKVGGQVVEVKETSAPTGEGENEIARFGWKQGDVAHATIVTEAGAANGLWRGDCFSCADHEGDAVEIRVYAKVCMTEETCKACGSGLDGDYCSDSTCVYSDWPQRVAKDDLVVFDVDEVETMYGVKKRESTPA